MKKFLVIIYVMSFTAAAFAQDVPANQGPPQSDQKMKLAESVQMKGGKVWLTKDGKSTIINDEITIGGTKVKADGSVVTKGGTTTSLKEGDRVNSDGTITRFMGEKKAEPEPKH